MVSRLEVLVPVDEGSGYDGWWGRKPKRDDVEGGGNMCMIVIVRLDLDRYDVDVIERLVADGVITVGEAVQSKAAESMSEYEQLMWIRKIQVNKFVA